jgi:hypothetical protein
MKRQTQYTIVLPFILAFLLLLAGCSGALDTTPLPATETGKLSVAIDRTAARTFLPAEPIFDTYSLSFTKTDAASQEHNPGTLTINRGESFGTIELDIGSWNISAKAYVMVNGQNTEAAENSVSVMIRGGETTGVTITLTTGIREGIPGKLVYNVAFPAGVSAAELSLSSLGGSEVSGIPDPVNLLNSPAGNLPVAPGYYIVSVTLTMGRTITDTDVVHIYSGMETVADYTFTDVSFTTSAILQGTLYTDLDGNDIKLWVTAYSSASYLLPIGSAQAVLPESGAWEWSFPIPASYEGQNIWLQVDGENDGVVLHSRKLGSRVVNPGINTGIVLEPSWASVLIYDGNLNTGGTTPEELLIVQGSSIIVANNSFTRTNRFFAGWNTNADGTGTNYYPGNPIVMDDENIILYAIWIDFSYDVYDYDHYYDEWGNYRWKTGISVTGYTGKLTSITIPATILGYPVTTIGHSAFQSKNLSSIILSDSITRIESYAFNGNRLTAIQLGSKLEYIGYQAFYNNQLRGTLVLPAKLRNIAEYAFANNQISALIIPEGITTIGSYAFQSNQIKELVIPDSVTSIESYAFAYNYSLWKVQIGKGIAIISNSLFSGCPITDLVIGENVTDIQSYAFSGNNLEYLLLPEKVYNIGQYAFGGRLIPRVTLGREVFFYDDNVLGGNFTSYYDDNLSKAGNYTYSSGVWSFDDRSTAGVVIDFSKPPSEVINFTGNAQKVLSRGAGDTLQVKVSGTYDSYTWVVNGNTAVGAEGDSIIINPANYSADGEYLVTAVVYKNGVPHSAEFTFVIME